MDIVVAPIPREKLAVGHIGRAHRMGRVALGGKAHRGKLRRGELHHPASIQMHHCRIASATLVIELHKLHRLQIRIAPIPYIETNPVALQDLFCILVLGFGTRRGSEVHPTAAIRKAHIAILAHPPPLRALPPWQSSPTPQPTTRAPPHDRG